MAKNDDVYYVPAGSPVLPDKFDVRVRLRTLTRGTLTNEELKKHLAQLPDDSAHADFRSYDSVTKEEGDTSVDPDVTH